MCDVAAFNLSLTKVGVSAPTYFSRKVFIMADKEKENEKKLSGDELLKLVQKRRRTTHQTKAGGKVIK